MAHSSFGRYTTKPYLKRDFNPHTDLYVEVDHKIKEVYVTCNPGFIGTFLVSYPIGRVLSYYKDDVYTLLKSVRNCAQYVYNTSNHFLDKSELKDIVEQWQDDLITRWECPDLQLEVRKPWYK